MQTDLPPHQVNVSAPMADLIGRFGTDPLTCTSGPPAHFETLQKIPNINQKAELELANHHRRHHYHPLGDTLRVIERLTTITILLLVSRQQDIPLLGLDRRIARAVHVVALELERQHRSILEAGALRTIQTAVRADSACPSSCSRGWPSCCCCGGGGGGDVVVIIVVVLRVRRPQCRPAFA